MHWRRKNGQTAPAALSVNGDETVKTDLVTTAKGSVYAKLARPNRGGRCGGGRCGGGELSGSWCLSLLRKKEVVVRGGVNVDVHADGGRCRHEPVTRWCDEGGTAADSAKTRSAWEGKRNKLLGFSDLRKEEVGLAARSILTLTPTLFFIFAPLF